MRVANREAVQRVESNMRSCCGLLVSSDDCEFEKLFEVGDSFLFHFMGL